MENLQHGSTHHLQRVTLSVFLCLPLATVHYTFAFPATHALLAPAKEHHKGDQQKQVEQLEQQWQTAILAGDTAGVGALLADSYVGIGPDGTISTKTEDLQARSTGQQHIEKLNVEDRKIRMYGTTAVVTSKVRLQGTYFGQPLLGEYRYTRVWTFDHGQWHIVSFEASRIHDVSARSH